MLEQQKLSEIMPLAGKLPKISSRVAAGLRPAVVLCQTAVSATEAFYSAPLQRYRSKESPGKTYHEGKENQAPRADHRLIEQLLQSENSLDVLHSHKTVLEKGWFERAGSQQLENTSENPAVRELRPLFSSS